MNKEKKAPLGGNREGAEVTNSMPDDNRPAVAVKVVVDPITDIESLLLQSTRLDREIRAHTERNNHTEAKDKTRADEQNRHSKA